MYARATTIQVSPELIDEAISRIQSVVAPVTRQQPGYHDLVLLVDRRSGKCLMISLWETSRERQATGATSAYLQRQIATLGDLLTMTPVVEDYDAILAGGRERQV